MEERSFIKHACLKIRVLLPSGLERLVLREEMLLLLSLVINVTAVMTRLEVSLWTK